MTKEKVMNNIIDELERFPEADDRAYELLLPPEAVDKFAEIIDQIEEATSPEAKVELGLYESSKKPGGWPDDGLYLAGG